MTLVEKIAKIIKAETEGGYLQGWQEYSIELTPEQQADYFRGLGQIIKKAILSDPSITYTPPIGNPKLGDIKTQAELGCGVDPYTKKMWVECRICHKPRWVRLLKGRPQRSICRACPPPEWHKNRQPP